jgi:hypothetical protein
MGRDNEDLRRRGLLTGVGLTSSATLMLQVSPKYSQYPIYFLTKSLHSISLARATWVRSDLPVLAWEARWNLTMNWKGGG